MGKSAPSEKVMQKKKGDVKDPLISVASQIEKLKKDAAFALIPELLAEEGLNDFRLGGILSKMKDTEDWWTVDGQYSSFKEFLLSYEFGSHSIHYRKASYLISIYNTLIEANVRWSECEGIGWTKLKELRGVLTEKNKKALLKKAKNMTTLQLIEAVKKMKEGSLDKTDSETAASSSVSQISFKVHDDQKKTIQKSIDKAKKEAETEYPAVALEAICQNYLSGAKVASDEEASLLDLMKKNSVEDVIEAFEAAFPEVDLTVAM